jgi:pantoate--beta-alanine ligase
LFVNPKQFGPGEDFTRYPRDEGRDAAALAEAGADLLFAPDVAEIYPPGHATRIVIEGLGDDLEGEFRPGFFTGVATVVAKLLLQALPDAAVFGEKDYQQLLVVKRMVADLNIPVRIEGVSTVREADGLALSSRNAYLSPDERKIAPALYATIGDVAEKVRTGTPAFEAAAGGMKRLEKAGFGRIDYLVVRDAETLAPIERWGAAGPPARVLAAAWLGKTRLIDNRGI